MKKLITAFFFFITLVNCLAEEAVYFAQFIGEKGVILEDHVTFKNNVEFWEEKDMRINYTPYVQYMKDIARKYADYNDTIGEYVFDSYKPEFAKLTSIKPGTRFYVSSDEGVYLTDVKGYYMRMVDEIGGGSIFYVLLNTPMETKDEPVKYTEYEILVASTNGSMTAVDRAGVTDPAERTRFKNFLMPYLKKVKDSEMKDGKETWKKMDAIDDADLKIYKAPITHARDEKGKPITLVLVSFCRRVSFTEFASGVFIMDEKGKLLKKFSVFKEKNFYYMKVTGIVDIEGDGVYEIITEDGYYEGSGAGFWQYYENEFRFVASGFAFGV